MWLLAKGLSQRVQHAARSQIPWPHLLVVRPAEVFCLVIRVVALAHRPIVTELALVLLVQQEPVLHVRQFGGLRL